VAEGTRPLLQHRRLTYRYDAPFHLVLRIEFLEAGGSNVIGFFLQPETADSCRLYTTLWRDDLDGDTGRMAEAVAFEKAVLDEDLAIQTAFDRLVLPLERTPSCIRGRPQHARAAPCAGRAGGGRRGRLSDASRSTGSCQRGPAPAAGHHPYDRPPWPTSSGSA